MASLFEQDLHSSDSEDDDYVPDGEVTSEDDDDPLSLEKDDEIETKKKSKKNGEVFDAEKGEKTKITEEPSSAVDQKKRANDLFKNFLEEVEAEMKMKEQDVNIAYVSPEEVLKTPDSDVKCNGKASEKLFEFAGETVAVSVENGSVSSEKSSGSEFEKNTDLKSDVSVKSSNPLPVAKKPKGLASVLNTIMNKKSKLTTLEKTSLDWKHFKKEHGISEELKNFNRGRGGYIERKRFLERSDLRSYEIERDNRMTKRKKN